MTTITERGAIISGIGISRIGRRTGIPGPDLTEESSLQAIADAGLTPADIDGIATIGDTPLPEAAKRLGIEPKWTGDAGAGFGRGGLLSPVMSAFNAASEGRARHILVYRTVQMMGGAAVNADGQPLMAMGDGADIPPAMLDMLSTFTYHAYSAAHWLAMHAKRHMHLYGTTKEQMGGLAVNSRANAMLNPLAAYRDPITLDDYMMSRPIAEPFGLLDCDVPIDGSIAVVVSPEAFAADIPNPAVRVQAIGGSDGLGGWDQRPDYPKMASADAGKEMWARTDLKPSDVDVAELYDGFTFLTLAWLEALGFCGEGESGAFVEGGKRIALKGGDLPLNTYGGQLSAGRMHGYWVLHEACLQLRGQAGERQVEGAEVAAVSNGGGPIAGCMLLTN